jgi:PleD family two-component response regulator
LRFATSGETALQLLHEYSPDLILLDAELPGTSGFKVFEALKSHPALKAVPVIFITSHHEGGFEVSALNMGASDFIAKPFQSSLVLARVKLQLRAKRATDGLRRANAVDALTGVGNRNQFDDMLQREWLRTLRNGDSMALLLVSVEHFKSFVRRAEP